MQVRELRNEVKDSKETKESEDAEEIYNYTTINEYQYICRLDELCIHCSCAKRKAMCICLRSEATSLHIAAEHMKYSEQSESPATIFSFVSFLL